MSTDLAIKMDGPNKLPAYLQNFTSSIGKDLAIGGGAGNRIGLKGCRFRLVVNGEEEGVVEENFLDLIIVGATPAVSRIYYEEAWDADNKVSPTCYSKDGNTPEKDSKVIQSTACKTCPQNQVGSRISENGQKSKACSYFKRLAVVLPTDPNRIYKLDAKGMSIFGEGKPAQNKFSVQEYGKKLHTRGIDPCYIVTRFSFDTDESVPKLLLTPQRYLEEGEVPIISDVVNGDEVKTLLDITVANIDTSTEAAPAKEDMQLPPPAKVEVKGPTISKAAPAAAETPSAPAPAKAGPTISKSAAPVVKKIQTVSASAQPVVTKVAQPEAPASAEDEDLEALLAKLDAE